MTFLRTLRSISALAIATLALAGCGDDSDSTGTGADSESGVSIVASTNEAPGTGGNNSSTDTIDVECPDVWVEKDADSATVNANDTITWTITFGNDGPGDAYDVTLTDNLPTSLTGYVLGGTDAALCDLVGTTLTCDFDNRVIPNDSTSLSIRRVDTPSR